MSFYGVIVNKSYKEGQKSNTSGLRILFQIKKLVLVFFIISHHKHSRRFYSYELLYIINKIKLSFNYYNHPFSNVAFHAASQRKPNLEPLIIFIFNEQRLKIYSGFNFEFVCKTLKEIIHSYQRSLFSLIGGVDSTRGPTQKSATPVRGGKMKNISNEIVTFIASTISCRGCFMLYSIN